MINLIIAMIAILLYVAVALYTFYAEREHWARRASPRSIGPIEGDESSPESLCPSAHFPGISRSMMLGSSLN
jgi:hypothetical protein